MKEEREGIKVEREGGRERGTEGGMEIVNNGRRKEERGKEDQR